MALKKQERQAMILEILAHNVIDSQEEILHRLQHAGIAVTQATVSRDIKELRIVRRPDATGQSRYQVMVVVKTTQGNGNRLAAMIDAAEMPDVIGTLAGHNTIYVTTPTADAAVALVEQFNNWMQ